MERTDVVVLGAGIVGVSVALHLARRKLAVALVDREAPGHGTSFGNAGIIEGSTVFPPPFPRDIPTLARVATWQAPEANYHLTFLPRIAPWLLAYRACSSPERLLQTAKLMRPLFSRAVAEHEALIAEAGAEQLLRKTGWLKLYRSEESFAATMVERRAAEDFGISFRLLDVDGARALEPALAPIFRRAVFWDHVASVSDPLALTRAYVERFVALGGRVVTGDALTLRRGPQTCRVETAEGRVEAGHAVIALGPWTNDLLTNFGLRLPLAVKRGYHRHFATRGDATLARPVLDADNGYVLAPMDQGIRLTTGVEFADRDAPPTPAQLGRVLPAARRLFPLAAGIEPKPWMGARPCLPDARPVIGQAPGHPWLWIATGHAHWGLTLGPVTGRLIADMMTGTKPFCDPAPYRAERFSRAA
ncbi:MAG: FAD-dependent oxidoreductase [Xanthobacteraceae bacterium]